MMIVPANWNLPDAIRSRVSPTSFGRQRAIIEGGQLLLLLHKPPAANDAHREGVLFWRDARGEWQASRGAAGGLKRHIQDYADIDTKLSEKYERADDTTTLFEILEALNPVARAARNMHLALQDAREGFGDDPFLIEMRDAAYDVERNLELLLEDVQNALQYRAAREAEEQARLSRETLRASHRLNTVAALFLPVTAITSVFGMNLSSGLNPTNPTLFWLVLLAGVALGGGMVAWVLARPRP